MTADPVALRQPVAAASVADAAPQVVALAACPVCGHPQARELFPPDALFDNDIASFVDACAAHGFSEAAIRPYHRNDYVACRGCGVVYARRRPDPTMGPLSDYAPLLEAVEKRAYNTFPLPDLYRTNQEAAAADLLDAVLPALPIDAAASVLHVRCEAGSLLAALRERTGAQALYGLDFFPEPQRHAREVYGLPHVATLDLPEFSNPFDRVAFDVIFANHLLTHAHRPKLVLERLRAHLAPGGAIVIYNEPDHAAFLRRPTAYPRGINFFHKQLLSRPTLALLLEDAGFAAEWLPHPPGRKWATPHDSMLAIARPRAGAAANAAPRPDPDHLVEAFTCWRNNREAQRRREARKALKRRLTGWMGALVGRGSGPERG